MVPRISLATAPAKTPITLAEAKTQCRIDVTDHDTEVLALINEATEWAEDLANRALITQTLDLYFDGFLPLRMDLPRPPLQSVTSIKYYDTDGDLQTLDSSLYQVIPGVDNPGYITPAYGQSWPATRSIPESVIIRIIAGYGDDEADIKARIRNGMKMYVEAQFDRDSDGYALLMKAAENQIMTHRVHYF